MSRFCCSPNMIINKLFTKEDPKFIHKFFGFLSLGSFVYRYFVVFPREGNLGFEDNSWFDIATMLLHLGLSTSSLIFHVLRKRIIKKATIIWHEYRLHAIVFTLRCVTVYLHGVYRPFKDSVWERLVLIPIVLMWHLAADEITRRHGPDDSEQTTVRVTEKLNLPLSARMLLRFYAFYQFSALGSHLAPHSHAMADMGFNTLIAIQSSAFLMTLVKKGLIKWYSHGLWYTACLILSLYHMRLAFPDPVHWYKIAFAFLLRTKFGINKYILWTSFVIFSIPEVETWVQELLIATLSMYAPALPETLSPSAYSMPSIALPTRIRDNELAVHLGGKLQALRDSEGTQTLMCLLIVIWLATYKFENLYSKEKKIKKSSLEEKSNNQEKKTMEAKLD